MKINVQERNIALLESIDQLPVSLAPKQLQDAANLAERARLAFNLAEANALLAPANIISAERAWEVEGEQSIRAGRDLPPKTVIERATIDKRIADADLVTVTGLLSLATTRTGAVFNDQNLRDEWITTCEQKATELRTTLLEHVAQLRPVWRELSQLNGAISYLAQFGDMLTPPPGLSSDPFGPLETAAHTIPPTAAPTQGVFA